MYVAHALRLAIGGGGGGSGTRRLRLKALVLWAVFENVEIAVQVLINLANAGQVVEPVAVVGSRPHCSQFALKQLLVTFLADLVGSVDPYAAVGVQKPVHNVGTEHVAGTAIRKLEASRVVVRVRPHEIGEGTLMRDFLDAFDLHDVVDVLQRG